MYPSPKAYGTILDDLMRDIALKPKIIYIIKSKNGERRNIPISRPIARWLRELKDEATGDYVLDNQGRPLTKRSVQSRFKTACKHAGIENFRFHDLRHTFASYLVMNGTDLKTVQELLGHKTFSMTLRYAHLSADHKQKAVEDFAEKMQSMVTIWSQDSTGQISNQVKP